MKIKFTPVLALAGLLTATTAYAQETVYSDPVGVMTVELPGGSDTRLGVPFANAPSFASTVSAVGTDFITLSGNPDFTPDQFAPSAEGFPTYYVLFSGGVESGLYLDILSNTADTLTMSLGSETTENIEVGDPVSIIPHKTLAEIFEGATVPAGTRVFLYDNSAVGVNKSSSAIITYFEGFGWFQGATLSDSLPVKRNQGIIVRTPSGAPTLEIAFAGNVSMINERIRIPARTSSNDVLFSINSATPMPLANLNLSVADQTRLFIYDNQTPGVNKSSSAIFTYFEGFGWFQGATLRDAYELQPGVNYVLRIPSVESDFDWIATGTPSYLNQ